MKIEELGAIASDTARWTMVIACQLPDQVKEDLSAAFDTEFIGNDFGAAAFPSALAGRQVLLASSHTVLSRETINALPDSVRAIATYSVGHEHIDLEAARARAIAVFNTPDVLTPAVAEVAMLLMLGAARRATESIALVRSGTWKGWTATQLNGIEVSHKQLGIFGMGRIGRAIAKRAAAFGMTIHYCNRKRLAGKLADGARFHSSLEAMLSEVNVLVLSCPLTPTTRGLMNEERIALLRPDAILVNVARGDLIDDDSLIRALSNGKLYAVGLDVFAGEPRMDSRYLKLPNVFMLPHIGSSTVEARRRMGLALIAGITEWRKGQKAPNQLI